MPILVFANKQDLPNAIEPHKLADKLGVSALRRHKWYIQGTFSIKRRKFFDKFFRNECDNRGRAMRGYSNFQQRSEASHKIKTLKPGNTVLYIIIFLHEKI